MIHASGRTQALSLAVALAGLLPQGVSAGETHRKGEGGKAAVHAARVANAGEHKGIMQQQAAIQHKLALKQQQSHVAINGSGLNGTGINRTGVHHHGGVAHHRTGVGTGQHHTTIETGPMVSSLHSVVGRLHQADHDYDGHRVQAIHQLEQAVHTLNGGTNGHHATGVNAGIGKGTGTGKGGTSRLSQAESDAHLRQAHQELMQLESWMSNGGGTMTAHHQQAHGHIQQALQHLNTALATR